MDLPLKKKSSGAGLLRTAKSTFCHCDWHDIFHFLRKRTVMAIEYPLEFTLENGTHVVIRKNDEHHYDFALRPKEGTESHFTYDDTVTYTSEMEDRMDFDQLNALRRFWLEKEKDDLL